MAKGLSALKKYLANPNKPISAKVAISAMCCLCTGNYDSGAEDCKQGPSDVKVPCPLYQHHPYNPRKLKRGDKISVDEEGNETKVEAKKRKANPKAMEALKLAREAKKRLSK
jgi:hypothetical protein